MSQFPSRTLAAALEPCIGQVYFAPEAHAAYQELGFAGSAATVNGLALPDGPAYFTSRGSLLGQVAPSVVAAAFAVFNPEVVAPSVQFGWTVTDAATIRSARRDAAVAQLRRVASEVPNESVARAADLLEAAAEPLREEGRPLFAGARDCYDSPSDAWTRFFHLGDMLREFRGDAHTAAWISAGIDATEIGLLGELYMRIPPRTYVRTRAWSDEQLDAATERLAARGWMTADGTALTDAGLDAREAVEVATDAQLDPSIRALGSHHGELVSLLEPWGAAVRAAGGYPGGPADLWPRR